MQRAKRKQALANWEEEILKTVWKVHMRRMGESAGSAATTWRLGFHKRLAGPEVICSKKVWLEGTRRANPRSMRADPQNCCKERRGFSSRFNWDT